MNQPPVRLTYRLLSYLWSSLLAMQPLLPAVAATLTPTGNTSKDNAANGVPVVNIAKPNGAGISHNQFKDYNVGKEGMILNNATGKLNQTQLGGLIRGNANLKVGQEAKGIINEVTGGNRSQLQGYTEVAGKAANVMVANPYGITCNGCGFINTPQATLTTGKPVFDASGNLQALDVKKGSITIEGQGIDASSSDALSIISRATEVNAAIHARDLKVVVGANRVGTDGSVQAQQGEGHAPRVAVDTGALGGMYANRIHLVSSEKGVGVNLGNLNTRQGDIILDTSGKLTVNHSLTSGVLSANGESLTLTGDHKSSGSMSLNSQSDIALSNGSLNSDGDLVLNANGEISHVNEKLTAGRDATLIAKNISQDAASQINAARDITTNAHDTLKTQGQMTAGQNLAANAATLTQGGKLLAKNSARLKADTLNNSGSVQGALLSVDSSTLSNAGSLLSGGNLTINTRDFTQSGSTGAKGKADITASGKLNNTGSLVSDDALVLKAQDVTQNGVLSGSKGLTVNAQTLSSGKNSVTHSNATMTLNTATATLDGETSAGGDLQLQGDRLTTAASAQLQSGNNLSLIAREAALAGTQAAQKAMTVNAREKLTHSGKSSAASLSFSAPELTNSGVLVASSLNTQSKRLNNSGLMQGDSALLIDTQKLDNQQNGTLYSAANLTLAIPDIRNGGLITSDNGLRLSSGSLSNPGKIIADTLNVKATTLNGDGLLQGTGALTLDGDILSQGANGRWLTAGDLSLSAKTLNTAGTTQGQDLNVQVDSWMNNGTVLATGNLNATLASSLMNNGDLLSQKSLTLSAGDVTNSGRLQGQNIALDGSSLNNSGAIQSALDLALTLSGDIIAATGSKITALGGAHLSGKTLSNQGIISAKTLAVEGDSFSNGGEISGVNGLNVTLSGDLQQQGKMLTGGLLDVNAKDVSNSGQLQGADTQLSAHLLINSGRVQGNSGLTLTLLNALTNQTRGVLLSQNALSLTAPVLTNDGTIQGNGNTTLSAATQARNGGTILSGSNLTFTTPDYSGSGWLQATNLMLNVTKLASNGTVMAANQATLSGNSLTNGGTFQAGQLNVNVQTITNSGTLLGNQGLTLKGNRLNNARGKVLSGGDMLAEMVSLSGAGQLVAIGSLTLKLTNSLTSQGVIAANKQLSISSQGDITNEATLQGNGITLNAVGRLTNNGQLISGSGNTALSGSQIEMNARGSLQAGGDVSLTSWGNIILDGFTGTAGSLALTAAGAIVNTALLYAGNNLSLFANSIQNLRGDMLAGNNLLMQKDTSGAANAEVFNTSGNIETTNGDITIKTAHLLNRRDGMTVTRVVTPGSNSGTLTPIPLDQWWELRTDSKGPYLMVRSLVGVTPEQEYRIQTGDKEVVTITVKGNAGRIVSGSDMKINAGRLENEASFILAGNDMHLQGNILNNQSWQEGTSVDETVWTLDSSRRYVCGAYECEGYRQSSRQQTTPDGRLYRGVISAGGTIDAAFSSDISNSTTAAGTEGISGNLHAPAINNLKSQEITGGADAQVLINSDAASVDTPQWLDGITDALQSISGGIGLASGGVDGTYPLPVGNNGYFVPSTDPDSPYLITVNPNLNGLGQLDPSLFGDLYKLLSMNPGVAPRETSSQFLGSAYILDRLKLNPDKGYRFLGDAAFDTRYASNTVLNQTGARYINGLGSDLDQMRYLMDNAVDAQSSLGLKFGVALTAEQVAALDHSILWYESVIINGQTVMMPKVYLSPKDVMVQSGSVISGNNVQLAGGTVTNSGSSLLAQNDLAMDSSNSLSNLNAGLIKAGGALDLSALGDINNIGAAITGKTVQLESTGGSINNITQTQQWSVGSDKRHGNVLVSGTDVGQTASISASSGLSMVAANDVNITGANVTAGGDLTMVASNDLNLNAVGNKQISRSNSSESHQSSIKRTTISGGDSVTLAAGRDITSQAAGIAAEGNIGIQAGRDVNLLAKESVTGSSSHSKKKTVIDESVRQQSTELASSGNTTIIAGRDVNSEAAQLTSSGDIGMAAGRDVNLTTVTESDYHFREETKTKKGFLSKKTTHTIKEDSATREAGTLLSGDNVTVQAGNNLLVKGSAVVGDGDVALSAGNNVDILAATNTDTTWRFKEEKKSGLMGTGGIGFTIGSSKSTHDLREQGTTQSESFSTVGSTGGNVSIAAAKQAHIGGADIIAQKDISLIGDSVVIEAGHDKRTRDEKFEQKSSGLTVALSGAAGSAVNSAVTSAQSAKQSSDSRLAALQGTQAALSGVQAGQAVVLDQVKGSSDKSNNNTIGVSASIGAQSSRSSSHMESEATTGSTLSAGNNVTIKATGSDISVVGSQIKAGKDVTFDAARDVNFIASQETQQTTGKNSSSGGSLGGGVGVGSGGVGISISANANGSKGHEKGNGIWQNETTVDAGNRVTINTGRDATIAGAQVSGAAVLADIGRDLTIASTQDSDHYDSKQNSISGGVSYTFGAGGFSGSISASRDKMISDYDSVQEQSGLFAGSGGYDVTVGNHTQLDGGVIASTALPDKNRLDTGTLGFSDIQNQADFKTEHQGAGISSGGSIGEQFVGNMANGLLAGGGNSGHAEGTTKAAVSNGTIIVRDQANQKQDIAELSRDTGHANGSIGPIFDKEKEQQRLQLVQLIGEIGSQAADIARTQGEIHALTEARKAHPGMSTKELQDTPEYKAEQAKYGTGSDLQRGIQAATAALRGLAGSDLTAALAGASAPELAHLLKSTEGNPAVNIMAHAILGGAIAALQGNSIAAGAAGAATGELAARAIAGMLYPDAKDLSKLSEEQKQTVSALATIAAGMAGGLAGNSTGSAVVGGQAGKNAVENNALGDNKPGHDEVELEKEHGNLPLKIHKINPLQIGQVDDEGNTLLAGGKVTWPVKETNAGKGTSNTTKLSSSGKGSSQAETKPSSGAENSASQSEGKLPWISWQSYPKQAVDGRQYAKIGDRLYSQHAVDRMQPSGLGSPAGTSGPGRNITPNIVEHTIKTGTPETSISNGVPRTVYWSGDVGVVTENKGNVIVTILRRSGQ